VERIGQATARLILDLDGERSCERAVDAPHHAAALGLVEAALREHRALDGVAAIGHRVVHGGDRFRTATRLDENVVRSIRELVPLAPLHQPACLLGIAWALAAFPVTPQFAVFDTAFHQTLPPRAFRYAVPESWYTEYGLRRYGFHGTSHRFVAERAAQALQRPLAELDLVTLHLGGGASAAAIHQGESIDTSMGFTPLEGLVMGTRSGDLDPGALLHVQRAAGLGPAEVEHALQHASGLLGLCGASDLREVLAREASGDERATLALAVYVHRLRRTIGAFLGVLGGADAIVFTGGVGENATRVRTLACAGLERLGIMLDEAANAARLRGIATVSRAESPIRVLVVPTDEALAIARETINQSNACR
jgi:acetate kinase